MKYFDSLSRGNIPTKKGDKVRSKGEATIANLLWENEINYEYEAELLGVHPDFLVYAPNGKVFVWEYVGPGMLEKEEYIDSLFYKFNLFKRLNHCIYRVIFSDNSITPEEVVNKIILNLNSDYFFSSLPLRGINKDKFVRKLYEVPYRVLPESNSNIDFSHLQQKQLNNQDHMKLWIIDTSFFNKVLIDSDTLGYFDYLSFHRSRSNILTRETEKYNSCLIQLQEAWEIDLSEKSLTYLDLSCFYSGLFSSSLSFSSSLLDNKKKAIPALNAFFRRTFNKVGQWSSPSSSIRKIITGKPKLQSQIQILVDTSNFTYEDINKHYKHLENTQHKVVKNYIGENRRISRVKKNVILDFEIIFEDNPLYFDIYKEAGIEIESHIRELEIKRYKYNEISHSSPLYSNGTILVGKKI